MQSFRVIFGVLTLAICLLSFVYLFSDFSFPREIVVTHLINSSLLLGTSKSTLKNKTANLGRWSSWFLPHPSVNARPRVTLLLWTTFFGDTDWLSVTNCPRVDCVVTSNKSALPNSTAVVFHWRSVSLDDLPVQKAKGQQWILYNMESPHHTPQNILVALGDKTDIVISYRSDSDIVASYGRIRRKTSLEKENQVLTSEAKKTPGNKKLLAWLVSHCNTPSNREKYVQELQRYVPIDIFGKCGQSICDSMNAFDCYQHLGQKYKFYLSFENSICKDYVTEKLFYALAANMVPVVFGGANYTNLLPPHSFIDALSFSNPRYLAFYLRRVANNKTEYDSFLSWKKDYVVEKGGSHMWSCELCERLLIKKPSLKHALKYWWYDKANCKAWTSGQTLSPI